MKKYIVHSNQAPAAIGPYSQAVRAGNFLYISGQIALDPITGNFMRGKIEEQTERILNSIAAILKNDGMSLSNIVKTNIYIIDITEFERMNVIYEKFFGKHKPARACVQVAALPKGARIEIDTVAFSE